MNKHTASICWLLLCIFFSNSLFAQQLSWSPQPPVAGQHADLHYNPKGGDLEFSDQISGSLVWSDGSQWRSSELVMKKANNQWTASYQLPPTAVFAAVKFFQGTQDKVEALDNNSDHGFYTAVLSANKKTAPGTYLSEAKLITPGSNMLLNGYISPVLNGVKIDSLLNRELAVMGSSISRYLSDYLDLKKNTMDTAKFKIFAGQVLQNELKNKKTDEDELAIIQRYYAFNLRSSAQAAKVEEIILRKYPKGSTARFIAYSKVNEQKTDEGYRTAAENFLKDFPYQEWKQHPNKQSFIYYTVHTGLEVNYFSSKMYDQFLAMFKEFDFKTANEVARWNITKYEMTNTGDKKVLFGLSSKILPYLFERRKDGSYHEDFGGDVKMEQENADNQLDDRLFTHVSLACATKNYQDGLAVFKYLSPNGRYGNADLNEMHMKMLKETEDSKAVFPLLEASVKANAVTPAMFAEMKQIYMDQHKGSMEGYEQYLSALIPEHKKAEMRAHVMACMVNYPLIPFTLESAEGGFVSSSDWKDKIVVIDFWATWCRPCIAAFPGMQLLIDQYAKDPKVAVYMIGTMQFGDYKGKSVNYVKSQGYRFHLLHDAVSESGEQNKVFRSLVPLFNSSGIPRKIIVKNGVVRYSSEGYGGSPSELKDELSMAIEILRTEK